MSFRIKSTHQFLGPVPSQGQPAKVEAKDEDDKYNLDDVKTDTKNVPVNRPTGGSDKGMAIRQIYTAQADYM